MTRSIRGATILITGGTGSFGNRVAAQLQQHGPKEIRIFSRDEKKQWEMQQVHPDFRYFIGDVRDERTLDEAMRGVDFVFHAAALKQVPSCEMFPMEAVKTNTLGAANVCSSARRAGVKVVVALSTDKAVKPVNAMGISKAMMEKIVCSQNQFDKETIYCCVRYGNVMGSRGSVIPLYRKLISEGKPLPMTVPGMTRFLMTLDESVDLVLHAMTRAKGGEIFVRKAPAVTVLDLASAVARRWAPLGAAHPTTTVGIRAGEKMHEVLVNEYEMQRATDSGDYYAVQPEYAPHPVATAPLGAEYTSENTTRLTAYEDIAKLLDAMGQTEYYL